MYLNWTTLGERSSLLLFTFSLTHLNVSDMRLNGFRKSTKIALFPWIIMKKISFAVHMIHLSDHWCNFERSKESWELSPRSLRKSFKNYHVRFLFLIKISNSEGTSFRIKFSRQYSCAHRVWNFASHWIFSLSYHMLCFTSTGKLNIRIHMNVLEFWCHSIERASERKYLSLICYSYFKMYMQFFSLLEWDYMLHHGHEESVEDANR